ncbi:MAG: biotin--[acetyl-CoA-carboxylase] ligase [Clostridia bacterium]|jgi:BirA family biotin operon repressor/biotin-[acetyl-CoA-carboxylase] ligase|nr:biotin--[acetyl-CoA-carboxylase] ligase [Clostridia bacterium]
MKKEVLQLLLEHQGSSLSGEEISRRLGVSRTAVWKHINTLKEEGYRIDSIHSQGYRLSGKPDILNKEEIELQLPLFVQEIQIFPEITSTNEEAKKKAAAGAPEGTVVAAEKQLSGKGRMGRPWVSDSGVGLWFSIVLKPPIMPAQAAQLTFVSAVAVCRAVREFTGLDARIKWPNDILLNDKKICGILTELSAEIDRINYMVAGIGLNVNHRDADFAPEIAGKAGSLAMSAGKEFRRAEVLICVLNSFAEVYQQYLSAGFARILAEWRRLNCVLGEEVEIISARETYRGYAVDIDADGQLLVKTKAGELRTVIVGDVSLRRNAFDSGNN